MTSDLVTRDLVSCSLRNVVETTQLERAEQRMGNEEVDTVSQAHPQT